jgi:hypothetical protein
MGGVYRWYMPRYSSMEKINRLMTREQMVEAFGEDDLVPMNLED